LKWFYYPNTQQLRKIVATINILEPMEALDDLSVFLAVADTGGFSAAARKLGITTAGASKSVMRLETRLSTRLFTRTTRKVNLTDAGLRLHTRSRPILEAMHELLGEMGELQAGQLTGAMRLSLPVLYGHSRVVPLLAAFQALHPAVQLDIRLSDRVVNLVEDGIDIALRIGDLPDSSWVASVVQRESWVMCASPSYIAQHGIPKDTQALAAHRCIGFVMPGSGRIHPWRFMRGKQVEEITPATSINVNDVHANRALGIAGAGLIFDLRFGLEAALQSGELVEIWPERAAPGPAISILTVQGRHQSRRVKILREFLVGHLKINT
jgi:LysR family transcriptional regulator, regulator for bpeEF and oprC